MRIKKCQIEYIAINGLKLLSDLTGVDSCRTDDCCTFENEVFAMRTYCWCEGDKLDHADGCPPNFEYKKGDFSAEWYKHIGRGLIVHTPGSFNVEEWTSVIIDCANSVLNKNIKFTRE
jgi:hypothetical protein